MVGLGLIRKVKCVINEGEYVLLNYNKKRGEWDLPGAPLHDIDQLLTTAKFETEQQLGCDIKLEEFLGSHDYDHNGDLHRTFLFRASVKEVKEAPNCARLINIRNLDKPTLNEHFAQALPQLKRKLLVK